MVLNNERKLRKLEFANKSRFTINSVQHLASARLDFCHTDAAKGLHLANLTQLNGAARARSFISRTREQRRLRIVMIALCV